MEAGKKLPRKIPSLAERFGANHTIDVEFLIIFKNSVCAVFLSIFRKIFLKVFLHQFVWH